jgi:hypothetical protein
MVAKEKETAVEGEIVEETIKPRREKGIDYGGPRRTGSGLFFGIVLLVWGLAILSDSYLGTILTENLWPMFVVVLGLYMIASSFKH